MRTTKILITVAAIALITILLPTPASANRRGNYHGYRARPPVVVYHQPVYRYPVCRPLYQPVYQPVYYVYPPVMVHRPVVVVPQPVYQPGISFNLHIR